MNEFVSILNDNSNKSRKSKNKKSLDEFIKNKEMKSSQSEKI
jgi:hypothetical protein